MGSESLEKKDAIIAIELRSSVECPYCKERITFTFKLASVEFEKKR